MFHWGWGGGGGGGGGEGVPGRRSILQEKVCICLRMSQKTVHVRDGHEHTDEPRSVLCLNTHAGPRNAVCECVCVCKCVRVPVCVCICVNMNANIILIVDVKIRWG